MLRALFFTLCLAALGTGAQATSYLDQAASEVYAEVYKALGITLPEQTAHDPVIWQTLAILQREPCDQKAVADLGALLQRAGYRRQAALGEYNFVKRCGEPVHILHTAINSLLELSDYPMALEVADEFVRRAPTSFNAHYLRGVALEANGYYDRALVDYADTIELFNDKTKISFRVFEHMAMTYAKLKRYCEAISPISTWVAFDPANRDTSRSQKIIADYEAQGECAPASGLQKERFAVRGSRQILAKGEVNGVRGTFIIDTGASYVSLKRAFAQRAKIPLDNASDIVLSTANGRTKGKLTRADLVVLGKLHAAKVPVVVQDLDDKSYSGLDGLLGMSFLSRFDMQMAGGFVEIRTRQRK